VLSGKAPFCRRNLSLFSFFFFPFHCASSLRFAHRVVALVPFRARQQAYTISNFFLFLPFFSPPSSASLLCQKHQDGIRMSAEGVYDVASPFSFSIDRLDLADSVQKMFSLCPFLFFFFFFSLPRKKIEWGPPVRGKRNPITPFSFSSFLRFFSVRGKEPIAIACYLRSGRSFCPFPPPPPLVGLGSGRKSTRPP